MLNLKYNIIYNIIFNIIFKNKIVIHKNIVGAGVKNLILKIKGLLGFCQCDKCWHRAVAELEINQINKKLNILDEHMDKIINDSIMEEILVELGE